MFLQKLFVMINILKGSLFNLFFVGIGWYSTEFVLEHAQSIQSKYFVSSKFQCSDKVVEQFATVSRKIYNTFISTKCI